MKSTNYYNTFIEVAEDYPVAVAEAPPVKGDTRTVANIEYDLIAGHPYTYTSDDVVFHTYAMRNSFPDGDLEGEWEASFSKGRPCLRSSPLAKRYGWGIHHDADGKIALVAVETPEYQEFATSSDIRQVKAMRSKRA